MAGAVSQRQSMRFCGRSYMAFLFTPELPLENWLADLDSGLERSPGFFVGRPVVLDLGHAAAPLVGECDAVSRDVDELVVAERVRNLK